MNRSNYAAERAEQLPLPPEVIYLDVEEITLQDVAPARQQTEYKLLLTEQEQDDLHDEEDFDLSEYDDGTYDEPLSAATGTFNYGFDPTEFDAESGHRAFCNNFED